ncbi:MAG TPA: peptide deformylase, partial [Alcanivorax sp.]|nr:peptide deformylase [Alcanivorax sp.]
TDQYAEVTRPKVVDVEWIDRDGNPRTETFDGLWATCVQHEIDHLNGKLFVDYVSRLKRDRIKKKLQKVHRQQA